MSDINMEIKSTFDGELNIFNKIIENDYEKLINLPSINGVELLGNKTGAELGLVPDLSGYATKDEIPVVPESLPNPNALTFTGAVNATYDGSTAVSVEIPRGGSGGTDISLGLTSASVGQIIKVKAVDESGKPTEWEAADISAAQTYEVLFEVEEAVESVEWDFVDDEGNPVLLQEVEVIQHFISTNKSGADLQVKFLLSNGNTRYVLISNNYANTAGNWVAAVSIAKIYGETLYVLSNKKVGSEGSLSYDGEFTKHGTLYPHGWGDRWREFNGVKIRGIIGLKVPGAVGAKGQFYVCGVKAK